VIAPSPDLRPLVLVDGSNVAHNGTKVASLANLTAVLDELARLPVRVVALADATLPHRIDRRADLEALLAAGKVQQVPAGTSADDFLWQLALHERQQGRPVWVVTNDRFPETRTAASGIAGVSRVAFLVVQGKPFFQPPSRVSRRLRRRSRPQPRAWPWPRAPSSASDAGRPSSSTGA
jgi:hypothetical protein